MASAAEKTYQIKFIGNVKDLENGVERVTDKVEVLDDKSGNISLKFDIDQTSQKSIDQIFKQFLDNPENAKVKLQIDYDKALSDYKKFSQKADELRKDLDSNLKLKDLFGFDEGDATGPQKALDKAVASLKEMEKSGVNSNTLKKRARDISDFIKSVGGDLDTKAFDDYIKGSEKLAGALKGYKPKDDLFSQIDSQIYSTQEKIKKAESNIEKYQRKAEELIKQGAKADASFVGYAASATKSVADESAEESADALDKEAAAFERVAEQAAAAASAKLNFTKNNQELKTSAEQATTAIRAEADALERVADLRSGGGGNDDKALQESKEFVESLRTSKEYADELFNKVKNPDKKIRSQANRNLTYFGDDVLSRYIDTRRGLNKLGVGNISDSGWLKYLADIPKARPYLQDIGYDFNQSSFKEWVDEIEDEATKKKEEVSLDERTKNLRKFLKTYQDISKELNSDEIKNAFTGGLSKDEIEQNYQEKLKAYRKANKEGSKEDRKNARYALATAAFMREDPYEGMSSTLRKNIEPSINKVQEDLAKHQQNLIGRSQELNKSLEETRGSIEGVLGAGNVDISVLDNLASGLLNVDDAAKQLIETANKRDAQPKGLYSSGTLKAIRDAAKDEAKEDPIENFNKGFGAKEEERIDRQKKYLEEIKTAWKTYKDFLEDNNDDNDNDDKEKSVKELEKEYDKAEEIVEGFNSIFGKDGITVTTNDGLEKMIRTADDLANININDIIGANANVAAEAVAELVENEGKLKEATESATASVVEQQEKIKADTGAVSEVSAEKVEQEGQAAERASEKIQEAAVSKLNFTEANMKLASSADESVDNINGETESIEKLVDTASESEKLESLISPLVDGDVPNKIDDVASLVDDTSNIDKETDELWELVTAEEAAADAAKARKVADSANDEGIVSTGESLAQVRRNAVDAADAVIEFVKQNDYVYNTTKNSYDGVNAEAQAFERIRDTAREAAEQKEAFAKANEGIPATADATAQSVDKEAISMKAAGEAAETASKQKESAAKKSGESEDTDKEDESSIKQLRAKAERNINSLIGLQLRDAKDINGKALSDQLAAFNDEREKLFAEADNNPNDAEVQNAVSEYKARLRVQMERVLMDLTDRVGSGLEAILTDGDNTLTADMQSKLEKELNSVSTIQRILKSDDDDISEDFVGYVEQLLDIEYDKGRYKSKDNILSSNLDAGKLKATIEANLKKYGEFDTSELEKILDSLSGDVTQSALSDLNKQFQITKTKLESQASEKRKADAAKAKAEKAEAEARAKAEKAEAEAVAKAKKEEADRRAAIIKQGDEARKQYDDENKNVSNLIAKIPQQTSSVLKKITSGDLDDRAVSDVVNGYLKDLENLDTMAKGINRGSESDEIEDYFRKVLLNEVTARLDKLKDLNISDAISAKLKIFSEDLLSKPLSFDFIKEMRGVWDDADKAINSVATIGKQKTIDSVQKRIGNLDSSGQYGDAIKDLQDRLNSFTVDTPVSELKKLEDEIKNIELLQSNDKLLQSARTSLHEFMDGIDPDFASQFANQINYLESQFKTFDASTPTDEIKKFIEMLDETKASSNVFSSSVDEIVAGYEKLASSAKEIASIEYKQMNGAIMSSADLSVLKESQKRAEELLDTSKAKHPTNTNIQRAEANYGKALNDERQNLLIADAQKMYAQMQKALNNPKFTDGMKDQIREMETGLDEVVNKIKSTSFDYSTFEKANNEIQEMSTKLGSLGVKENQFASLSQVLGLLRKVTSDIANNNLSGELLRSYESLKDELTEVVEAAQKANSELTSMNLAEYTDKNNTWKKMNTEMYKSGMAGKGFMQQFRDSITSQSASFIAQYFSLQDFIRYGRELVQTVTTIDTSMTELRKVSGETDTRLAESFKQSATTAKELGATISDVINVTADWSRLGYSIDEAEELARVTQIYQNVGDNLTSDTASEYLVSTLQGFQLNSDEALRVVDSINSVANNYAVDTQMIGESLERSAASFNASGTDLNKAIALVSATAEVTQDAASAGTVWKTMSARIRGEYAPIYNEDCSPHRVKINAA